MRKLACCILILLSLNSCTYWRTSQLPLDQALGPDPGARNIRVWLLDQRSVELRQPMVTGSTIAGISADRRAELVVIPRDSVRNVEILTQEGAVAALVVTASVIGLLVLTVNAVDVGFTRSKETTCVASCR